MSKANKRGQEVMGMSFGTIFSIILIIFIVAVAFIAIRHFVGLSKCTNVGLFYDDLREEVTDAWSSSSGKYEDEFESKIPKSGLFGTGITHICFGKLSDTPSDTKSNELHQKLIEDYLFDPTDEYNVFAYPPNKGCDSGLSAIVLKCGNSQCVNTKQPGADVPQFFCQPVEDDGSIKVKMVKQPQDSQISLRST